MTATTVNTAPKSDLGTGATAIVHGLSFSLPGIALGALATSFSVYLPRYFASYIGVSTLLVGVAFFVVRLIDVPLDPVLGVLMDRTRTRFGRYRVWMVAGVPVFMAAVYMVFFAQPGAGLPYLIVGLLAVYVGTSIVTLAHISWASVLAPSYKQRSFLFGVLGLVGVAGAAAVLVLPTLLDEKRVGEVAVMHGMGWLMIIAAPITVALALIGTPEKIVPDTQHGGLKLRDYVDLIKRPEVTRFLLADFCLALGPGWMSALYLFFFHESRGFSIPMASLLLLVYVLAGLLGAPMLGALAAYWGKHRALIVATTGYSLGLVLLFFMPKANPAIDGPFMFVMGFLAAGFGLLLRAIVADVGDLVRLETGRQQIGLLYALITGTQKLANAFSIGLTFVVLAMIGYNTTAGSKNTPQAIFGLELTYLIGPIFFVMVGGACFLGYKLDEKRHSEIRSQLDERDGLSPETPALELLTGDFAQPPMEEPKPDPAADPGAAPEPKPS